MGQIPFVGVGNFGAGWSLSGQFQEMNVDMRRFQPSNVHDFGNRRMARDQAHRFA